MKASCLSAMTALMAFPLIAACGVANNPGGQSMARITATIEKSGFTCEVKKRHPRTMSQVGQCRSNQDKHLLLIVSQWHDPKERDRMYEHKLPGMCDKLGLKSQVRWSSLGSWVLVAGGSREKDVKALDEATSALGFAPHAVDCQ